MTLRELADTMARAVHAYGLRDGREVIETELARAYTAGIARGRGEAAKACLVVGHAKIIAAKGPLYGVNVAEQDVAIICADTIAALPAPTATLDDEVSQ